MIDPQGCRTPNTICAMVAPIQFWDGDAWEDWIDRLLKARYGHKGYQKIPAGVLGDFGMEGYSTDGCVYQCYAPEEPISAEERYKKHRVKMTEDLRKFVANKEELAILFGTLKIERWLLLVPRCDDKRLMVHASKKAKEIVESGISYVTPDFRVSVVDDSYFEVESRRLTSIAPLVVVPAIARPGPNEVSGWVQDNPELLRVMDDKISRIPTLAPGERITFRNKLIERYIEGQNTLQGFHEQLPELAEVIVEEKNARAGSLVVESMLNDLPGNQHVLNVYQDYSARLRERIQELPQTTASTLGWDAVVEWLFTCPLQISR